MLNIKIIFISLIALILSACGTTSSQNKHSTYKKTTTNITIGSGVNRPVALYAMKFLGTPYRYGGSSPSEGFDCSGLIQYSTKNTLNINIPRTAAQQSTFGKKIKVNELQAGDLVFFNTSSKPNSHSGIYLGSNNFVHAPSTGGVVRVDSLNNPYWKPRINMARRIQ